MGYSGYPASGGGSSVTFPIEPNQGGTGTETAPSAVGSVPISTSGNIFTPAQLTSLDGTLTITNTSGGIDFSTLSAGAVFENITLQNLDYPHGLMVTPMGTTGATNYYYTVTALDKVGLETNNPTGGTGIGNGNATLNGTNYNALSWSAVTNAVSYNIYRFVVADNKYEVIANVPTGTTTLNDTGLTPNPATNVPYVNQTGRILWTVDGVSEIGTVSGNRPLNIYQAPSGIFVAGSEIQFLSGNGFVWEPAQAWESAMYANGDGSGGHNWLNIVGKYDSIEGLLLGLEDPSAPALKINTAPPSISFVEADDTAFYAGSGYTPIPISAAHFVGAVVSAPTIAAGAAAGSSPTISIAGTDAAGQITLTIGTTPLTGVLATVTFNLAYISAPYPNFCAVNGNAAGAAIAVYVTSTTTTLVLNTSSVLVAGQQYIWNYMVMQ